ncbi:MAG: transposase [Aulosira sp. DedQUE10]|nr:transposase [Aulosira sp. DedQUE10]
MNTDSRRQELLNMIFESFPKADITILAWVILPNRYHILVHILNFDVLSSLFRHLHGVTSRQWNREENLTQKKSGIFGAIALFALKNTTTEL